MMTRVTLYPLHEVPGALGKLRRESALGRQRAPADEGRVFTANDGLSQKTQPRLQQTPNRQKGRRTE